MLHTERGIVVRRRDIDAALAGIYARIPAIPDCDGRCWISCGPIGMTSRERARIRQAGYRITPEAEALASAETFWCEALTAGRRCAVYELRPLVCRLWGAVEDMRCPFGCVPEGGFLPAEEGWQMIAEAEAVAGHGLRPSAADMERLAGRQRAQMDRIREAGQGGVRLRTRHLAPVGLRRKLPEFPCPHCGFMLTVQGQQPGERCQCGGCLKIVTVPAT